MKRGLVFLSLVFATMILFFCAVSQDEVLNSLGAYRKKECFSHGGLQDYTDYAKYYYDDIDFEGNPYFKPISKTDTDILHAHIDDFEKWLECFDRTSEIVAKYDFDRSIIDMQDYLYIYDDPRYPGFGNYNVYFWDSQVRILYYFHNNI